MIIIHSTVSAACTWNAQKRQKLNVTKLTLDTSKISQWTATVLATHGLGTTHMRQACSRDGLLLTWSHAVAIEITLPLDRRIRERNRHELQAPPEIPRVQRVAGVLHV